MAYAYGKLSLYKSSHGSIDSCTARRIAYEAGREFLIDSVGMSASYVDSIYESAGLHLTTNYCTWEGFSTAEVRNQVNSTVSDPTYRNLLNQALDILEDSIATRSYQSFDSAFSALEQQAANTGYENEIATIASIARHSWQYWEGNLVRWRYLFQETAPELHPCDKLILRIAVEEDVRGGLLGCLGGPGSALGCAIIGSLRGVFIGGVTVGVLQATGIGC